MVKIHHQQRAFCRAFIACVLSMLKHCFRAGRAVSLNAAPIAGGKYCRFYRLASDTKDFIYLLTKAVIYTQDLLPEHDTYCIASITF